MTRLPYSLFFGICLIVAFTQAAFAERRVALVIGNANYINTISLPNVDNDAPAIAATLKRLNFEVIEGRNVNYSEMKNKLRDFARVLLGADVGLFFYAGHGMQVAGENYLVPVDATLKQESDLEYEAFKVDSILKQMFRETKIKIVLLDACRDNPLAAALSRSMSFRSRSLGAASSGLSAIDATAVGGTIIAFATAPGSIALDGRGSHSPFTQALLEHIETPGLDIDVMMKRVRGSVAKLTNDVQQPWTNSSLNGDFSLAATVERTIAPLSVSPDAPEREISALKAPSQPAPAQAPDRRYDPAAKPKIEENQSKNITPNEPVTSPVTLPDTTFASSETEKDLKLSSEEIRDLHARLMLLGFRQAGIRSAFNKKSRAMIIAWQSSKHLVPTGFLNRAQIDLMVSESGERPDLTTESQGNTEESAPSHVPGRNLRKGRHHRDGSGHYRPGPSHWHGGGPFGIFFRGLFRG